MIPIPNNVGKWIISHSGDLFGVLKRAENVNFDKEGYITPSRKACSIMGSATDVDFLIPLQILYYNLKYFILTSDEIWELSGDLLFTSISETEIGEPTPNKGSDAVVFNSKVYVTGDVATDVRAWNGTDWNTPGIAISDNSYPHPMALFLNKNQLAIAQRNVVSLYDTSDVPVTADQLTIPIQYTITSMVWRHNNLYIGTKCENGEEAKMFVWNGTGTSAQAGYGCSSDWIFSVAEYQSSVVAVTNNGQLLRFNGGGFDELANFPVFYTQNRWHNSVSSLIGRVHMRGMKADGDLLYINVAGSIAGRQYVSGTLSTNGLYLPEQPSGLWCYDPKVGLHLRHYSTTDGYQSLTASSVASNVLTLSAAILAKTGDPILVFENGNLTGVNDDTVYYIIKVSSTTIKLAESRADALAGTAITLGGNTTSATFRVVNYDQHGELFTFDSEPGGIGLVQADSSDPPIIPKLWDTQVLWGFSDRSDNTYLNAVTVGSGIGYVDVVRILAREVKESWNKLITKVFNFFMDSDRVIVRANHISRQDIPTPVMVGTYSNDSTIGSSSSFLDRAQVDDTVVIVSGNGGGQRRKISAISGDELTLSEAVDGALASDTLIFYIDPHKEYQNADTDTETVDQDYVQTVIGKTSAFVDLSIEARGSMSIPQLLLDNTQNK